MSVRGTAICTAMLALAPGAALAASSAAALAAPAAAAKVSPAHCASARTNRFYRPVPGGRFGAFALTATGVKCATARSVAFKYVRDPFSVDSPKHATKRVSGWSCTWRSNLDVAQEVSVTCTRAGARIAFHDRLPSG